MNLTVAAVATASGLALVVLASRRRRRARRQLARAARAALPSPTGIELRGDEIFVSDPTRAFEWISTAVNPSLSQGASATDLLVDLFSRRFPERKWPPVPPTPQWDFMVERIDALLRSPTPPGRGKLRLVGA